MKAQVSVEAKTSIVAAAGLVAQSLNALQYSHRHKNFLGGCEECENIKRLIQALECIVPLTESEITSE